jgi:hypothetical protein
VRNFLVLPFCFACSLSAMPLGAVELSGPAFGLATAPNGDLVVAGISDGIVATGKNSTAKTVSSLPGFTDVSPIGHGSMWATRNGVFFGSEGQALYRVSQGKARMVADLHAFEVANNPHPAEPPDSNPFDVQALGGEYAVVADAAANDLLLVSDEGVIEVLAVFPDEVVSTANAKAIFGCPGSGAGFCFAPDMLPAQPVPTSVAIGPDGWFYVGELKGFPAPLNESRVWRVAPWADWVYCNADGSTPDCQVVFDGGFTSIIDLAFGPDDLLYVTELDEASWFSIEGVGNITGGTINACDVDTLDCVEVATDVPAITSISFGKDGRLWAIENGIGPVLPSVVEIP